MIAPRGQGGTEALPSEWLGRLPPHALPRLLIVAPHFPPETVAAAVRLGSLAAELAALGHEVVVVAPGGARGDHAPADDSSATFRVHRVVVAARRKGRLGNVLHQLALRRALAAGIEEAMAAGARPDAVLVSSPPPVAALAGRSFARRARLPLIVDIRDLWPDVLIEAGAMRSSSAAALVLRMVEKCLLSSATRVTVVTETKLRRLTSRSPGPAGGPAGAEGRARSEAPVILVPNGVDASWCEGGQGYAGGGDDGDFDVLHAGNIGLAQDVGLLAVAVADLRRRSENDTRSSSRPIRAILVGAGEDEHAVARIAKGAGDAVLLLPPESRAEVRERLSRCGCAFVSLRSAALVDAVPSKLLEAMGRGVPLVAAVAGEAAVLVRDAQAGFVTPPGDVTALADALARMATLSSAERRAMGQRGLTFVLSRYRRESSAAEMSRVLREICATSRVAARGARS